MTDTVKSGRWIITGQFQLITPMHIGTGLDKKLGENWAQEITLDQAGNPYIPGSSLKGALRMLAFRYGVLNKLLPLFGNLTSINKITETTAGQADFLNAWYAADQEAKPFDTITRVAIDRVTGTAEDRKLFNTRRVNPGVCFDYKIIIQNACETQVQYLLGLLRKAAKDPQFSLGAGANQTQGKVRCLSSCVQYFGQAEVRKWFQAIQNGRQEPWQTYAEPCDIKPAHLELPKATAVTLKLPLTLDFHTPFLVKADEAKVKQENEADAKPRTNHDGQVILPASSLRGRLRAQAERILRTLCQDIPQGHEALPYNGNAHTNLISLLFGAAGWKGIIRTSDFIHSIAEYDFEFAGLLKEQEVLEKKGISLIYVALTTVEKTGEEKNRPDAMLHICVFDSESKKIIHKSENKNWIDDAFSDKKSKDSFKVKLQEIDNFSKLDEKEQLDIKNAAIKLATQTRHEMVAIDRFTGGGKEGAKFNVDYVECPTLTGTIYLDVHRLEAAKLRDNKDNLVPALKPALGLISLLLRDLAEGDIPFGFGVNKGYGQCREHTVLDNWKAQLDKSGQGLTIDNTLQALRDTLTLETSPEFPPVIEITENDSEPNTLKPASNGFHNPYHFIPLNKPVIDGWPEADKDMLKKDKHGHDQYHTDKFSGRIVCRLTTKTPLFIGAETNHTGEDWQPSAAKPFKLNGQHALPATSLRGMMSSLFESVSNSNFRVLHPEKYSVRKSVDDYKPLSAMGRIVDVNGELKLKPLTLPTLRDNNIPPKWGKIFGNSNPDKLQRIYFDDTPSKFNSNRLYTYNSKTTSLQVFEKQKKYFLGKKTIPISTENQNKTPSLQPLEFIDIEEFKKATEKLKDHPYIHGWVRSLKDKNRNDLPDNVKHYVFLPYTPNITPIEIPLHVKDRFHELADLALASMHLKKGDTVESPHNILPYTPIGRNKLKNHIKEVPDDPSCYATRLKKGDLVFFDIDSEGKITEISFSSIWRTGIGTKDKLYTTADLLSQHDPNLVPLGMNKRKKDTDRFKLSPAERVFGVVEHRDCDDPAVESTNHPKDKVQAFAYTGKVRIGFGLPGKEAIVSVEQHPVTLKELSSPKPPSPAFYLKRKSDDTFVSKKDAAEYSETMTLRGRKYYLHAWRDQNEDVIKLNNKGQRNEKITGTDNEKQNNGSFKTPWTTLKEKTEDDVEFNKEPNRYINKRQVGIQPIKPGNYFYFEIDFNNLDQTELAQLCATLQPTPEFEHRLGMGKPLGLGSVKIEPIGLYLINRHQRYASDGIDCDRYHRTWLKGKQTDKDWPDYLKQQAISVYCEQTFNNEFGKLVQTGLATISSDIMQALRLFGEPQNIKTPVHYPIEDGGTLENEHFKWFGNNDKAYEIQKKSKNRNYKSIQETTPPQPQSLHAITKNSRQIPALIKNKVKDIDNRK